MDHHHHHHHATPLHWGYSTVAGGAVVPMATSTPNGQHPHNAHHHHHQQQQLQHHNNNTWTPPSSKGAPPDGVGVATRGLKRTLSESLSDDELYSEESSKEHTSPGGGTDSCQLQSRKRRRGVIEKKRRDRINSSLTELKRLVPSAYEKQGSAKLEKAEILQLTVDHLKQLHARGLDDASYDPQRFAMDYHIIGFRECVAEVARYLVTIEGMDVQDPLRLRLMSHLQCFATQRELSTKAATATSPAWSHGGSAAGAYQPAAYAPHAASSYYHQNYAPQSGSSSAAPYIPQVATIAGHDHLAYGATGSTTDLYTSQQDNVQQQQQSQSSGGNGSNSSAEQRTYVDISNLHPPNRPDDGYGNPQYPVSSSTHGYSVAAAAAAAANSYNNNNSSKPYRPWGAEMAC